MANIRCEKVCYDYEDCGKKYNALQDVSLSIKTGEFVCVIGPSGCGKSTLLSLLAGLRYPSRGAVTIDDAAVTGPDTNRAMVFQSYSLFPWMTAAKNVQFGISRARGAVDKAEANAVALDMLKAVGMDNDSDKYPYQMSGGMRQRVAIARAFAMDSDILLLDEPFGALDTKMRTELQALLTSLWENNGTERKTVVFVTHDIDEALSLADRIVFMRPQRIDTVITVDIPRPRSEYLTQSTYDANKKKLVQLFYSCGEECGGYERD